MNANAQITTVKPQAQPVVWLVDFSAPSVELEAHDAAMMPTRDRDGKFAPKFEKPITKKAAFKKLEKLSKKSNAGMDLALSMESW